MRLLFAPNLPPSVESRSDQRVDGGPQLFIVKIDNEGFESDVFAGDATWLSDAALVYLEPHNWMLPGQKTSRNFQREMANHDFEIFIKGENLIHVR